MTQETAISEAVLKVIEDRATQIAWHWTLASATIFLLWQDEITNCRFWVCSCCDTLTCGLWRCLHLDLASLWVNCMGLGMKLMLWRRETQEAKAQTEEIKLTVNVFSWGMLSFGGWWMMKRSVRSTRSAHKSLHWVSAVKLVTLRIGLANQQWQGANPLGPHAPFVQPGHSQAGVALFRTTAWQNASTWCWCVWCLAVFACPIKLQQNQVYPFFKKHFFTWQKP